MVEFTIFYSYMSYDHLLQLCNVHGMFAFKFMTFSKELFLIFSLFLILAEPYSFPMRKLGLLRLFSVSPITLPVAPSAPLDWEA